MTTSDLERSLDGRVVLITGGAVRLGRELGLACARRGANVAFTWHGSERQADEQLEALRALGRDRGRDALAVRCDVSAEGDVEAAFARIDERFGRVDLLVNNAAIFERTPFSELDLAAWQRHLDVNLTGSFLCAKRAGDRMLEAADGGVIVNVACAGGLRPWPGHVAYCVSKAGVVMLTQVLARALAPAVRVNAVVPGPVLFPDHYDEADRQQSVQKTALGRAGRPRDVVRAVLFCWDSDYTTGALVPVEGGRLLV